MPDSLPDVATHDRASFPWPLDWVGMEGIDIPVSLDETDPLQRIHAHADVYVDLPDIHVKGIHMSRLYNLLDAFASREALTPRSLGRLLQNMVASHTDCHATSARIVLRFDLMIRRAALVTSGLSGWRSYPVKLEALWREGRLYLEVEITVTYSSTCPCSAALARQTIQQAFHERFGKSNVVSPADVADWLGNNATVATPHSQRSSATISVDLTAEADHFDLQLLIDSAETALGTPVQTAVKRADEQAFAKLNGQNLMYVEDAARRVQRALSRRYPISRVSIVHAESLHPHDAVASASNGVHRPRTIVRTL